jgi:hypothetical protein
MPFEKNFWRLPFSSNIIKIPESSKCRSIEKNREKVLEKRERKKRKRKAPRDPSNKKGESTFWEEKNIATSKSFLYEPIFYPSIIPFQKTLSKIIWKNFAALFGPSFNLAIYMTWVVSFVFTYELHIFSL